MSPADDNKQWTKEICCQEWKIDKQWVSQSVGSERAVVERVKVHLRKVRAADERESGRWRDLTHNNKNNSSPVMYVCVFVFVRRCRWKKP